MWGMSIKDRDWCGGAFTRERLVGGMSTQDRDL